MPQKPRFLRKMMGFDGGVRVCASATLRCTNQTHVRYLEILGTATCVCVFTPFFTDFPMPYPFSPYSLMVYTANLDYLSPDFLPRKSGFYHIYTIIYSRIWLWVASNITWVHHEKWYPFAKSIGASGQNGKKYKLKRKKSFLYRRITGQRGATENAVATCPDAPIIPRKV